MFDLYPYTNFHELNQDWILSILKKFENELKQAIDYKTIHYADPLQWNITTQYAPNTVVVDENTGIAYISKDSVPSGILLSDKNYWIVIFDYQKIYNKIMSGVAFNEKDSETASKDLLVNDLVWYHGDLYRVTKEISTGSKYIIGTNLVATTIESLLSTYYGRDRVAQLLNDTINVSGDYTINAGDIAETATHVTIHSKQDMLLDADGKLTEQVSGNREIYVDGDDSVHVDGITTINRGGAVTEVYSSGRSTSINGASVEEYHDSMTETFYKKHIVNGNDEIKNFTGNVSKSANKFTLTSLEKNFPINFPDKTVDLYNISDLPESVIFINKRGAKGDGVTDDTTIFKNVLNEIKESKKTCLILLDPASVYKITDTLEIDIFTTSLNGMGATIKYTDNGKPLFNVVNSFTLPTNPTSINEFYNGNSTASYKGISHVQLINEYPDVKPTSTCFKFVTHELTTDTEAFKNLASCSMIQFYSVAVRGFYVGLEVFSRTYNIAWFGGLLSCFINVYIPDGGVDYYERLSFSNVTFTGIATSTESTCFLIQEESGVVTIDSSSIDYVKTVASMINGCKLYISNTHIETNTTDKYWFELYGGTPTATTVYLNNCVLSVQSPLKTPLFLVNTDVAEGGLIINGLYIWCVVDNEYYTKYPACLVNGGGRVIAKNISFNKYSTILPIASYMSIISDWQYYGGNPIFTLTNGTMDSTIKHSGTHSIKLNQNGSATLKINNLGNWLLGSIWCYGAATGILNVKINELNVDDSVAASSTFNIDVNNQWKANIFNPVSIHNYADKIEIILTSDAVIYIDDILLNIV